MQFTTILNMTGYAPVEAVWRINNASDYFQTVDVILRMPSVPPMVTEQYPPKATLSAAPEDTAQRFLARCIALGVESARYIKLVLPTAHGFVARRNFFERRLLDCPFTEEISGFLVMDKQTGPGRLDDTFIAITSSAAAGILLRADGADHFAAVEADLAARLAFPWLLSAPAPRYNVVLVEGYPHLQMGIGFIQAVKDLDVRLVVIGPKGPKHWLEDPDNSAGFCEALIPVDLAFDADLPARIAAAVRGYAGWDHVDGIFTAHDRYLVATAQAAEMLGLPAAPVRAHEISTDKYAMRQFQADAQANDFQLFRFAGVEDARQQIESGAEPAVVHYPAIVKPISGFASEGVAKVNCDAELFDSIARVNSARHGNVVIVETYIDGILFGAQFRVAMADILPRSRI
ncbi:ATP-grasp fold domain containing [Mycena venus]|uniref:ATP-grasp fold domain containing n=1 Tax=Mycena venus TaxID=2733690 RepID=A0A8H6XIQ4_9AGAR|nr:ATP-grasp fold domain containing [Mycena venus]